jgi:hypothetical protein
MDEFVRHVTDACNASLVPCSCCLSTRWKSVWCVWCGLLACRWCVTDLDAPLCHVCTASDFAARPRWIHGMDVILQ